MKISEFVKKVRSGEIDILEFTEKTLEEVEKINKINHFMNNISKELALTQAKALKKAETNPKNSKSKLLGVPLSVKDAICVQGVESTCGSRILEGYKPLFNATCVQKAIDQGAIIIGKTAQDEFGFGSFCTNVGIGFKIPKNPLDKDRCCGGSSGGSAGITRALRDKNMTHVSIGESTGGSIVAPASFCGTTGLCPTYGRVSRYGLMDYASSLDKIGPIAGNCEDAALLLEVMSCLDKKESTSADVKAENFNSHLKKDVKGMKIGVIGDGFVEGTDKEVADSVWNGIKTLESSGAEYKEVMLDFEIAHSLAAYYLLATAEASTNLAKYCGMRYGKEEKLEGNFNEYFTKVRSANFGEEAKRRIMLGTFARMAGYREAYYIRALKVRQKIIEDYKRLFKRFDVLVSPTLPVIAPKFSEIAKMTPLQHYQMDVLTCGPNFAGLPHLNVPCGKDKKTGMPIGMMFIADHFNEGKLLQAGSKLEQ